MAFWKKSDDPWDRKPEKQKETVCYEQDTPKEAANSVGADTIRPSESAEKAEVCPWCGKTMERAFLCGGRDGIRLSEKKPTPVLGTAFMEGIIDIADEGFLPYYKSCFICRACARLVAEIPGRRAPNYTWEKGKPSTAPQNAQVWGANPKAYEDYKNQWETKEEE